jgi:hypothetical protein
MIVCLFVVAGHAATSPGQDKPQPAEPALSVQLSFSVEEYDPTAASEAVLRCVVRNGTNEPIRVPVGYGGGSIAVQSGLLTLHKANEGKGDVKQVRVEPGQEQVVFELPLDAILLREKKADVPWRWDWPRRPEPPRSPIHKYRQPGFVDQARFTATVVIGTRPLTAGARTLTSAPAVLKVKPGKP